MKKNLNDAEGCAKACAFDDRVILAWLRIVAEWLFLPFSYDSVDCKRYARPRVCGTLVLAHDSFRTAVVIRKCRTGAEGAVLLFRSSTFLLV